jgi:prevent-host-death family protein
LYIKLYEEATMRTLRLDQDVRPLSEFRAGVASFVQQVSETKRPLLLTQRGRGVAVLLDVREYEDMRERLEVLEDIVAAREQFAKGPGVPHEEARERILRRLQQ